MHVERELCAQLSAGRQLTAGATSRPDLQLGAGQRGLQTAPPPGTAAQLTETAGQAAGRAVLRQLRCTASHLRTAAVHSRYRALDRLCGGARAHEHLGRGKAPHPPRCDRPAAAHLTSTAIRPGPVLPSPHRQLGRAPPIHECRLINNESGRRPREGGAWARVLNR